MRKFDTSIRRFSSISLKLLLVTIPNGTLYFSSVPQGRNISMKFSWCKECGEFNSDDHYIYYCGQESLRRNGVAIIVNKKILKCSTWKKFQKLQNDLYSFPSKPFITVKQVYAATSNAEEAKVEWFSEDLQDFLELTLQKRWPFRGLECKSRKSRVTWSNRQIWSWSTKWNRSKDNRVLPTECTGHSKHPLPTTQE